MLIDKRGELIEESDGALFVGGAGVGHTRRDGLPQALLALDSLRPFATVDQEEHGHAHSQSVRHLLEN